MARIRTGINLQLQPSRAFHNVVFSGFPNYPAHVSRGSDRLPRRIIPVLEIGPIPAAVTPAELSFANAGERLTPYWSASSRMVLSRAEPVKCR